jgi:hypothetical protein
MDSTGRYGFHEKTFLSTTERPIYISLKIPFIMSKTAKTDTIFHHKIYDSSKVKTI